MPPVFYYVLLGIVFGAVQLAAGVILGRMIGRCWWGDPRKVERGLQGREGTLRRIRGIARRIESDVAHYRRFLESANQGFRDLPGKDDVEEAIVGLMQRLVAANQSLQERLAGAEAQLAEQAKRIEEQASQANSDPLTGLANRRAFDVAFARQFAAWRRSGQPFGVILLDLDHFKQINDRFGHPVGDEALIRVGEILRRTVRETDLPARIGGEEFAVLCPQADLDAGTQVAERIREEVARITIGSNDESVPVSVSCGLACVAANEQPEALIRRADEALYAAKRNGRNCTYLHNGAEIVRAIEEALQDDHNGGGSVLNPAGPGRLESDAEYQVLADSLRSILARL